MAQAVGTGLHRFNSIYHYSPPPHEIVRHIRLGAHSHDSSLLALSRNRSTPIAPSQLNFSVLLHSIASRLRATGTPQHPSSITKELRLILFLRQQWPLRILKQRHSRPTVHFRMCYRGGHDGRPCSSHGRYEGESQRSLKDDNPFFGGVELIKLTNYL